MASFIRTHLTLRLILGYLFAAITIALFLGYLVFQARFLIMGPEITIIKDNEVIQEERAVVIEGIAENIVSISLNDRPIYTDEHGYFKETIVLENGYTVATLRAQDRYGRQTIQTQSFVYSPKEDLQAKL